MNSQCSSALLILVGIVSWAAAAENAERPIELLVRGDDMGHSLDVNLGFIDEVEKEVRAQIEKCLGTGLRFVYLDWHMASNGGGKRPDIVAVFQRLCREYRLLYTHDTLDVDGRYSGAKFFGVGLEAPICPKKLA